MHPPTKQHSKTDPFYIPVLTSSVAQAKLENLPFLAELSPILGTLQVLKDKQIICLPKLSSSACQLFVHLEAAGSLCYANGTQWWSFGVYGSGTGNKERPNGLKSVHLIIQL